MCRAREIFKCGENTAPTSLAFYNNLISDFCQTLHRQQENEEIHTLIMVNNGHLLTATLGTLDFLKIL